MEITKSTSLRSATQALTHEKIGTIKEEALYDSKPLTNHVAQSCLRSLGSISSSYDDSSLVESTLPSSYHGELINHKNRFSSLIAIVNQPSPESLNNLQEYIYLKMCAMKRIPIQCGPTISPYYDAQGNSN